MAAVGATTSCSLASSPQVLSRSKVRGRTKSRSRYRWVQLRARLQDKAEKEWESGQIVDVAVIGAGIGGLCCAAMLAKYGLKVVVCESHDTAGGAAHSFVRQGFHFDSGPSFHAGLSTKPSINPLKQVLWRTLEKVIPDVRERVKVKLVGSPLTHERYLRRHEGTYGPAIKAGEMSFPGPYTSIPGLLCCGDSTMPGIGVPAVAASGLIAAHSLVPFWDHLRLLDSLEGAI